MLPEMIFFPLKIVLDSGLNKVIFFWVPKTFKLSVKIDEYKEIGGKIILELILKHFLVDCL